MNNELGKYVHNVLKDVQHELGEAEVAELISLALDRKVERCIEVLEQELGLAKE